MSEAMCVTISIPISDSLFPLQPRFHSLSYPKRRGRPNKFSFVLLINLESANWVRASRIHQPSDKSHCWGEILVYRNNNASNVMIKTAGGKTEGLEQEIQMHKRMSIDG